MSETTRTTHALAARIPEGGNVYANRDGSKGLTTAVVRMSHAGLEFDVNVGGTLTATGELTFRARMPKGLSGDPALKDEIVNAAEDFVAAWDGWSKAADRAEKVLTAPVVVNNKLTAARTPKLASRVVTKPVTADVPATEPANVPDKPEGEPAARPARSR